MSGYWVEICDGCRAVMHDPKEPFLIASLCTKSNGQGPAVARSLCINCLAVVDLALAQRAQKK